MSLRTEMTKLDKDRWYEMNSFTLQNMRLLNYKRHKSLKEYVFLKVQPTTKTSTTPVGASTGAQRFTRCEAESLLLLLCSTKGAVTTDGL